MPVMTRFKSLLKVANRARLATMLLALWRLFKHPDTPRAPKLVAIAVLAYALSPIDLIPDFIPAVGSACGRQAGQDAPAGLGSSPSQGPCRRRNSRGCIAPPAACSPRLSARAIRSAAT